MYRCSCIIDGEGELSKSMFEARLSKLDLSAGDRSWFPKWFDGYVSHCNASLADRVPVTTAGVIGFLRSLRDRRIPVWRRLQAARAIETYQALILRTNEVDFLPIKSKLDEIA